MKALVAALLLVLSGFAHATAVTTNFTDLWWTPSESGWGANMAQEGDTLFVTLYVYNSGSQPTWFTATTKLQSSAGGTALFTGPLYATNGPYFGLAFDPANVTKRQVGVLNFNATQVTSGTLSYTVDGVPVVKTIERFLLATDNVAGIFVGARTGTWSVCGSTRNGYQESFATFTVTQDGTNVAINEQGSNYTCNYTGQYSQAGQMGFITGNGSCSDGTNQTFAASEVQVGVQSLTMRLVSQQAAGCVFVGRMGGMRRAP